MFSVKKKKYEILVRCAYYRIPICTFYEVVIYANNIQQEKVKMLLETEQTIPKASQKTQVSSQY